MHRVTRAILIRRRILDYDSQDWTYEFQNGVQLAMIMQPGWQAAVWHRLEQTAFTEDLTSDCESFLMTCRRLACPHILDVWADGHGKVLSAKWVGLDMKLISIKRGPWEWTYFGLPEPQTKRQALKKLREQEVPRPGPVDGQRLGGGTN